MNVVQSNDPNGSIATSIEQTAQNAPQMGENAASTTESSLPTTVEECHELISSQCRRLEVVDRMVELQDELLDGYRKEAKLRKQISQNDQRSNSNNASIMEDDQEILNDAVYRLVAVQDSSDNVQLLADLLNGWLRDAVRYDQENPPKADHDMSIRPYHVETIWEATTLMANLTKVSDANQSFRKAIRSARVQ